MFKKLAAEALGISDIGVIVPASDFDKVDADDYLFHEEGERIFFLIKSKKDEYCFTNQALIHVDGESAVSTKRTVKRYEFASNRIGYCAIETAGNLDKAANALVREFGLLIADVADAIEDHSITADETQELREKWNGIRKRAETFVRRCEKGDFSQKG